MKCGNFNDSYIKMKSEDVRVLAKNIIDSIDLNKEEIKNKIIDDIMKSSKFWRKVFVIPKLLEYFGVIAPLSRESAEECFSLCNDISYRFYRAEQYSTCVNLLKMCEHANHIYISREDMYYLQP